MRRIALQSLFHDRGKLFAALAGVAFAASLVLTQMGIYAGFLTLSSGVIRRTGGDVWVMPRGVEVIDNSDTMSGAARAAVASHPCVRRVRALVYSFASMRKRGGAPDAVTVVGFEPGDDPITPWTFARGLPQDLHAPFRVAVDELDLPKLRLPDEPIGHEIDIFDQPARVAATTAGMRSFTLVPFVFAEIGNARRILRLSDDQASYWVADLRDPGCADDVIAHVRRHPDLDALPMERFAEMTERYWVISSGAGTALGFSALLGLVVGVVIVGQTLYALTREHLRELATLKALGGLDREIVGFVTWQAGFLAAVGGTAGLAQTVFVRAGIARVGLRLDLTPGVLLVGLGAVVLMCLLASVWSIRAVLKLEAAEVFR